MSLAEKAKKKAETPDPAPPAEPDKPKDPDPVTEVREREKAKAAGAVPETKPDAPKPGKHLSHFGRLWSIGKDYAEGGALFKPKKP